MMTCFRTFQWARVTVDYRHIRHIGHKGPAILRSLRVVLSCLAFLTSKEGIVHEYITRWCCDGSTAFGSAPSILDFLIRTSCLLFGYTDPSLPTIQTMSLQERSLTSTITSSLLVRGHSLIFCHFGLRPVKPPVAKVLLDHPIIPG